MSVHFGLRRSSIFANKPVLTEHNLPDQYGKVFIVTGGSGGVGSELVDILFQHNGRVYIATRSESKTTQLINRLKAKHPNSKGELIFLKLTLDDLTTIKASAEEFLSKESRLDVLWNNAGVMIPPEDQRTKQGYEMQLGINNLGHFVFTHALEDVLKRTAASAPKNSVRVLWVSSSAADAAPDPPIDFANITYNKSDPGMWQKYTASKAGSVLYSTHFTKRNKGSGVLSLALNPGNFITDLQQHMPKAQLAMFKMISHPVRNGGYTELFAGLSEKITEANNGGWVSPHGKIEPVLKQLANPETAKKYWDWSENEVRQYL